MNKETQTIFIGSIIPESLNEYIKLHSHAAQYYQEKVVLAYPFKILFSINYSDVIERVDDNNNHIFITLKKNNKLYNLLKVIKIILGKTNTGDRVFFYNLSYRTFLIFEALKFKGCKCYVIVADYTNLESLNYLSQKVIQFFINRSIKSSLGVLALNKNIKIHPNTLYQNALIKPDMVEDMLINKISILPKTILFSGSIGITTGIDIAIRAMDFLPEYKLIITGTLFDISELEMNFLLNGNCNNNIEYKGILDRNEYLILLAQSEYGLSLRNINDSNHQYNFPSKIAEYLSFNKKVISTIDYDEVSSMIYIVNYTPESVAGKIKETSDIICETRIEIIDQFGFVKFKENLQKLMIEK